MTNEVAKIEIKTDDQLLKQGSSLLEQANALVINDDISATAAKAMIDQLKNFMEGPGTYHDEEIDMAFKLHRKLCDKKNAIVNPVKAVWTKLRGQLAFYIDEQKRKAEEAQRKAEAEARRKEQEKQAEIQRKIDEEKARIQAQKDEEERVRRENQARIDKANKAERERLQKEEDERKRVAAAELEEQQRKAANKVETLEEKKENIFVQTKPVAAYVAPAGVRVTYNYQPVVIDKAKIPLEYMEVNISMLSKMQKAANGGLVVPGVEFKKIPVGSTRQAMAV